jgi:hypothetical protein
LRFCSRVVYVTVRRCSLHHQAVPRLDRLICLASAPLRCCVYSMVRRCSAPSTHSPGPDRLTVCASCSLRCCVMCYGEKVQCPPINSLLCPCLDFAFDLFAPFCDVVYVTVRSAVRLYQLAVPRIARWICLACSCGCCVPQEKVQCPHQLVVCPVLTSGFVCACLRCCTLR